MVLMMIPASLAASSDSSNPQLELLSGALRSGLKNILESIVMNYGLERPGHAHQFTPELIQTV